MERDLTSKLDWVQQSVLWFQPELILITGIVLVLMWGMVWRNRAEGRHILATFTALVLTASLTTQVVQWNAFTTPSTLFVGMLRVDQYSTLFKLLIDVTAMAVIKLTWLNSDQKKLPEYYALVLAIVLGAHGLVMSINFIMIFLSLELLSISAYVLTGFTFSRKASEASLKYFMFGSVASAVMLYGLSLLFGITGELDFTSTTFLDSIHRQNEALVFTASMMVLVGFLYKVAGAPMHIWSPDVYEASPIPVVTLFSVVPKVAGLAVLTKFIVAISGSMATVFDWQTVLSVVAMASMAVGNFAALRQKDPKRMMAYSSIAQTGFLLIGPAAMMPSGMHFMLFYATVYALANVVVFLFLQYFEKHNITTLSGFEGAGKVWPLASILMLIALISLTGLPPTGGFTGKLFMFSSLWEAYAMSHKPVLLALFSFGLLNTVVALFYYLRIPYYAFIRSREDQEITANNLTSANLFGLVLVVLILILFFLPGMLMGWINKINFVL